MYRKVRGLIHDDYGPVADPAAEFEGVRWINGQRYLVLGVMTTDDWDNCTISLMHDTTGDFITQPDYSRDIYNPADDDL